MSLLIKGVTNFLGLTDTPASYSGQASKVAAIKATEDALEFIAPPVGAPSGLIAMWHGLIANIPAGWIICDGNNSTPNLLTRFVEGVATAATNPGATGGATSKATAGHQHNESIGRANAYSNVPHWEDDIPFGLGSSFTSDRNADPTPATEASKYAKVSSSTDGITDIRPKYYDIAFLMKT